MQNRWNKRNLALHRANYRLPNNKQEFPLATAHFNSELAETANIFKSYTTLGGGGLGSNTGENLTQKKKKGTKRVQNRSMAI